jgi:hypothetical protein
MSHSRIPLSKALWSFWDPNMGERYVIAESPVTGILNYVQWVATASATYLLHALLTPKNETGSLAELLDHHVCDLVYMPLCH